MRDEDRAEFARLAGAALQGHLRRFRLLAGDDEIAEVLWAESGFLTVYGENHTDEPEVSPLDKGCCCFSSRRLYFPNAKLFADLEWVWRVDGSAKTMAVVYSAGRQLIAVHMLADSLSTAEQVTAFAGRLLAQRDRRVAELPEDSRQQFGSWSEKLERRGVLDAALAEPVPQPQTRVGAWLRAFLLRDPGLMAAHRRGTGWNENETPVLDAAFVLQVRRFFGAGHDASAVSAFMSSFASLAKEKGQRLDLMRAETMVRSALGQTAANFDDILPGQRFQLACVLAAFVCHELETSPRAIDLLVIRSEQMAFDQGWNPGPAEN
jgi:hypothetical protein